MEQSDQEKRFSTVVGENRQRFGKIARTYAGDAAEDLLQEILLQVWRSLPSFKGGSACSTWCFRVAINTALTYQRKQFKKANEASSELLDTNASVETTSEQQTRSLFVRFLNTLSEIDQSVLLMHMERLNPSQISEVLGTSEAAVSTRLSRLRSKLASWEDDNG
ncbi:sigma-70 family RNA polymerase sigma factor [Novipirellula rosea]|uniref:Sigma-70 family RNA polymerase sigma factor n=1 Tax=Novipirellula rosea TaxID=1031540 RepID=A0ABP8MMU0_9BACT